MPQAAHLFSCVHTCDSIPVLGLDMYAQVYMDACVSTLGFVASPPPLFQMSTPPCHFSLFMRAALMPAYQYVYIAPSIQETSFRHKYDIGHKENRPQG